MKSQSQLWMIKPSQIKKQQGGQQTPSAERDDIMQLKVMSCFYFEKHVADWRSNCCLGHDQAHLSLSFFFLNKNTEAAHGWRAHDTATAGREQ